MNIGIVFHGIKSIYGAIHVTTTGTTKKLIIHDLFLKIFKIPISDESSRAFINDFSTYAKVCLF